MIYKQINIIHLFCFLQFHLVFILKIYRFHLGSNTFAVIVMVLMSLKTCGGVALGNGLSGPAIAGIAAGIPCSLLFLFLVGLLIYYIVNWNKNKRLCGFDIIYLFID